MSQVVDHARKEVLFFQGLDQHLVGLLVDHGDVGLWCLVCHLRGLIIVIDEVKSHHFYVILNVGPLALYVGFFRGLVFGAKKSMSFLKGGKLHIEQIVLSAQEHDVGILLQQIGDRVLQEVVDGLNIV